MKDKGNGKDRAGRSKVTHFLQNLEENSVFLCKYLSNRLAKQHPSWKTGSVRLCLHSWFAWGKRPQVISTYCTSESWVTELFAFSEETNKTFTSPLHPPQKTQPKPTPVEVQAKYTPTLLGGLRFLTNDRSFGSVSSHVPGGNSQSNVIWDKTPVPYISLQGPQYHLFWSADPLLLLQITC